MRLLIVSPLFPPMQASGALRPAAWARAWRDAGHEVTVLTTRKPASLATMPMEMHGIEVVELDSPRPFWMPGHASAGTEAGADPGARSRLSRMLRSLKERTGVLGYARMPDLTGPWIKGATAWGQAAADRGGPFDAAVCTSGPYTAALVGLALTRCGAVRTLVTDWRDLWTQNPLRSGLPVVRSYERHLERRVLGASALVTTVCEPMARALEPSAPGRVRVIHNGYVGSPKADHQPEPGPIRIVHTGAIYPGPQNPDAVVRAVLASDGRARLVLAGERLERGWGAAVERLDARDHVEFQGRLPWERSIGLQEGAGVLLALGFDGPAGYSLPGKLFEYLRAGPPIVVVGGRPDAPMAELLAETGRGRWVSDENPAEIWEAVEGLCTDPPEPDWDRVRAYERSVQSERLLEEIEAAVRT